MTIMGKPLLNYMVTFRNYTLYTHVYWLNFFPPLSENHFYGLLLNWSFLLIPGLSRCFPWLFVPSQKIPDGLSSSKRTKKGLQVSIDG